MQSCTMRVTALLVSCTTHSAFPPYLTSCALHPGCVVKQPCRERATGAIDFIKNGHSRMEEKSRNRSNIGRKLIFKSLSP